MNRILVVFSLCVLSTIGLSSSSYGAPACSICLTETEQEDKAIQCPEGHAIHPECFNEQIKSIEDIREIRTVGLRCHGAEGSCNERFLLSEILQVLEPAQREELDKRLSKAFEVTDKKLAKFEFRRLSQGIQDAFNLCCPAEGCGGVLDEIQGCNAATCQNPQCKAIFCYLCLERQESSKTAHLHVRDQHSGSFWDYRPGYPRRYHWLLARKELTLLFKKAVDPIIRESVLEESHRLLDERRMWPFPAGKMTANWLREVKSDSNLTRKKKIELLQNEAIYQRQMKNTQNIALIDTEIQRLRGVVLASLDVRDASGVYPQRRRAEVAAPGGGVEPLILDAAAEAVEPQPNPGLNIIPVREDDPRVTPEFASLGNMYQVDNVIFSGVARKKMTYKQAKSFCEHFDGELKWPEWSGRRKKGNSTLPSRDAYENLARAMGYPDDYNPNLLPNIRNKWFWSGEDIEGVWARYFHGNRGELGYFPSDYKGLFRCARVIAEPRR